MRTTTLALALLLVAAPARAAEPQVTDPSGDAAVAAFDLLSVRLSADAGTQRVALAFAGADPAQPGKYELTMATPACDTVVLRWDSVEDAATLTGCLPRQRRRYAVPTWSGDTLTFEVPRAQMPTWWAPGTRVTSFGVRVGPYVDVVVGALTPPADLGSGDGAYVLGS